jgi:hypothetical protein
VTEMRMVGNGKPGNVEMEMIGNGRVVEMEG